VSITPKTGTESGRERAKEQKSKRAKEQKIGHHPAGPGPAGVLRIETDGAVSTLRHSSLTWGRWGWRVSAKSGRSLQSPTGKTSAEAVIQSARA